MDRPNRPVAVIYEFGNGIWIAGCLITGAMMIYLLLRLSPLPLCFGPGACVVTDRSGAVLRAFPDDQGIWRYPVSKKEVSPLYIQALLAYEDRFFYHHPGINPLSLGRAAFQYLRHGKIVSGASTLSMQTARLLCPDLAGNQGSILGKKLLQMFRALQLEARFSKKEILHLYLTYAPFGSNIQGVQAAAMTWLGKSCSHLTHAEAALLAVLPQAPSFFRPDRHPDRAKKARNKVLDRMASFGLWTPAQVEEAKQEPVLPLRFSSPFSAPLAARYLHGKFPSRPVIQTTIDGNLQAHIQELVRDYAHSLSRHQSCAVLVVDHSTMDILVYVGSADFFNEFRHGHVNMISSLRSPGSALKPFLYGIALDKGLIHSHSLLLDTPRFGQEYMPENFTGGFAGPVTVEKALQDSLNLPAVQVLSALGAQVFHDFLKNAGARLSFPGHANLSLVLGGAGTDLFSLVRLYTALGRKGICGRPRLVNDEPLEERFLMSPGAAYIVYQMLARPMPGQQGLENLTGTVFPAWKTGTSFGFRDAWAIGVQGRYTAGVWIGRPDAAPCPGQYGAVTALPLLARVLESLPHEKDISLEKPDTVSRQSICWPLGMDAQRSLATCHVRHNAWILEGQIPATLPQDTEHPRPLRISFWVDDQGRLSSPGCGGTQKRNLALWPEQAEPWIPIKWRAASRIPETSPNCPNLSFPVKNPIQIIGINDESILTLPPGQKLRPMIPLNVMGGHGQLHWFLNRTPLPTSQIKGFPIPAPGQYELSVTDESGSVARIRFRVVPSDREYQR